MTFSGDFKIFAGVQKTGLGRRIFEKIRRLFLAGLLVVAFIIATFLILRFLFHTEEAHKFVVSGGIVVPDELKTSPEALTKPLGKLI